MQNEQDIKDLMNKIHQEVPHSYTEDKSRKEEINRQKTLLSQKLADYRQYRLQKQQEQKIKTADIINALRQGKTLKDLLVAQRIRNEKANQSERALPNLERVRTRSYSRGRGSRGRGCRTRS